MNHPPHPMNHPTHPMNHPVFVVTGAPNKGKSTFIKAMTNDESVVVREHARTTMSAKPYPFKIEREQEGKIELETCFTLWDTPGFENAAEMYEILLEWGIRDSDHPIELIRKFLDFYAGNPDFAYELEIFKPIADYACIVYVADCSKRFRESEYLREIELIRFTRLPRIAILNPIDGDRYLDSWRSGLTDYFNNIKVFNPHKTTFDEKLRILGAFSHLDDEWEEPLNRVIEALKKQRENVLEECARVIRRTVLQIFDREFSVRYDGVRDEDEHRDELLQQVRDFVHKTMNDAQREISRRFGLHIEFTFEQEFADNDLFDTAVRRKNLSVHQRAMINALVGGGIGVAIDAAAGGLTFGVFTAALGVGGGLAAYMKDISPMDLVKTGRFDPNEERFYVDALNPELGLLVINRLRQVVAVLYNRTAANTETVVVRKDLDPSGLRKISSLLKNIATSRKHHYSEKHKKELLDFIHEALKADRKGVQMGTVEQA
ncbi:MAG: DUF3482 domain-containing protein [Cyclonatronaceae bacterium]